MSTSTSTPPLAPASADHRMPSLIQVFARATRPIRAAAKTAVFFLKVLPMLPSKPLNWVTSQPVIEHVRYPTRHSQVEGDLYRPRARGPHPGVIVCLGVVPFGVDNPQLPHLEEALARAGFAALIYWSPAMRDLRLDPEDIENIALAYHWLLEQPYVDPERSGLIGTCVGGSFALMAAASPLIRDRVAFVGAFAPYASMWTFALDIASATRPCGAGCEPWQVDQLTRKVYVHTLTAMLPPGEAERMRNAFTEQGGHLDSHDLSADGQALYPLLTRLRADEAETALHRLPPAMQERLTALSPLSYLGDLHAPLIVFGHDRDDLVIPVSESRRLWSALCGRAGVRYTEFTMFQHVDPTKGKLSLIGFVQQLGKFFLYVYPMFRQAVAV
jgi:dienelactone hydrolase